MARSELSALSKTLGRGSFSFGSGNLAASVQKSPSFLNNRSLSKAFEESDWETTLASLQQNGLEHVALLKSLQRLIEGQQKVIQGQKEEIKKLRGQLASGNPSPAAVPPPAHGLDSRGGSGPSSISVSVVYTGDVQGHQDGLRQSVGQQLLGMGIKQNSAAPYSKWGLFVTTVSPASRNLQQIVESLRDLPSQNKIVAVMHEVASRDVNIQSKHISDMLSLQDLTMLEAECSIMVDLLYDGDVWIDCPQNTDAVCTLAEKIATSV